MVKREFISKTDTGLNLALIAKAKAKSDAQKVLMGRCIFMVDKMHTFTEQDIVKPYLDKLMIEVGNLEINRHLMSKGYECYGFEPKSAQEIKDEVMEIINNLLSEQGDTDA